MLENWWSYPLFGFALGWVGYTLGHWHGWKKGYEACHRLMSSDEARAATTDAIVRLLRKRGVAVESGELVLKEGEE